MTRVLGTAACALGLSTALGLPAAAQELPACSADDVTATMGTPIYQSRSTVAPVGFAAHPGVRCTLRGYATDFVFTDAAGTTYPMTVHSSGDGDPVTLEPGSPAHIDVRWTSYPGGAAPVHPVTLSFTPPGGTGTSSTAWTGGVVYTLDLHQEGAVAAGTGE